MKQQHIENKLYSIWILKYVKKYRKKIIENYRKIYYNIELFMFKNGFSHPQGSGYISDDKLLDYEILILMRQSKNKYPYLLKCVKDIRMADITEINSLNEYFDYDGTAGAFAAKNIAKHNYNDLGL